VTVRATFEIHPHGAAEALAVELSTGAPGRWPGVGAEVVSEADGVAVIDFPDENWGADPALLGSVLVAGEATESSAFSRCRLVGLDIPPGALPGPAFGSRPEVVVGTIVKPSLGLRPAQVAEVVAAACDAGATVVKDDEKLASPPWCPLEERVEAVAAVLPPGVTYLANVTGPATDLLGRARRAVDLGATGLLVNVAQGLASVLALRQESLGVPLFVHRAGSGPWCRNPDFGTTGAVLVRLLRLCGADYVIVGAFGGKLFDSEAEVSDNLRAATGPLGLAGPSWAVLGGGLGPAGVAEQVRRATAVVGGHGLVLLLGSQAYGGPGGLPAAVGAAVAAVARTGLAVPGGGR
jgi:ribulose-bisphosphate carboxylase large chain